MALTLPTALQGKCDALRSKFPRLRSVKYGVNRHYRFRIQPLRVGVKRCYQLRVGMEGERTFEYIPVHLSAFSERLSLEPAHETEAGVQLELSELLEWLDGRRAGEKLEQ